MLQSISIHRVSMFQRPLIIRHLEHPICQTFKSIQSIAHHVYQFQSVRSWGNSYPLSLTSVYYLEPPGNIFPLATGDSMPNLLITVNFTTLQIPVDSMTDMFNYSLQIMIGFTNDTRTVIDRTQATTLVPGTNLVGFLTWQLRQLLKRRSLSAFTSLFNVIIARIFFFFSSSLFFSTDHHDFLNFVSVV